MRATPRIVVALAAAAALGGFVRTTDRETKACLYWPTREVAFTVNPDRPFASPTCAGDGALEAVREAFAAWPAATVAGASGPCTDLRLRDGGVTTASATGYDRGGANENLVVFRRGWCTDTVEATDPCWDDDACANAYGCFQDDADTNRRTIAVTTVTYDVDSGKILDADIELADWDGQGSELRTPPSNGWYFTCGDDVPQCSRYGEDRCTFIDLRNTLTHEAGHFVGLAHVADTTANRAVTMYPNTGPGDVAKRDLSADDVAGVCAIYPAGDRTPTCVASEDGGCGTPARDARGAIGDGLLLAGAVGTLAAARRRRARAA